LLRVRLLNPITGHRRNGPPAAN